MTRVVIVSVPLASSISCHVYLFHAMILLIYYDYFILLDIPGPNLDTEMSVEFSVAFYSSTLHIYYLSLYWPDLKC